jgi:hypothetical protein
MNLPAFVPLYKTHTTMNMTRVLLSLLLIWSPLKAGDSEIRLAPSATIASIPEPLTVERSASTPLPVTKPDFQVESTQVKLLDVVESPPMAGLPPVEGTITLTVQTAKDPGLPDPPPPVEPKTISNPDALARYATRNAEFRKTRIAFVSATIYDRKRTRVTVYPNGGLDKAVSAWSNVDFNHFCGFGCFEAKYGENGDLRKYNLFVTVINEDTVMRAQRHAVKGMEYEAPSIPTIPDGTPAFVLETENPDPVCLKLIEDMHALYRTEGARMAEAEIARKKAYEERKAYLLANPPKPKDVTVHFWQRTKEENTETEKGGEP